MYARTRRLALTATLLAGCTGVIGEKPNTSGTNGPGTVGPGGGGPGGGGMTDPTVCLPGVPVTSQLPRLTRVQYDNTVRDLLGLTTQPSTMLAPDTPGSVDQRAWDGYRMAADALSTQVMASAASRAKVVNCTPSGDGSACARQIVEQFGRKVFRRPLAADELTRFTDLYAKRAMLTATGTFDDGVQLLVKAFLSSPSFLTRAEISETPEGDTYVLNPNEVASRLSYMLWGSMPDDALFQAADAGQLGSSAGILEQAQRMLKDPKARATVADFHQQYAHMGEGTRWAEITRDPKLYPSYTAAMTPLLSDETRRFFDYVVFDRGGSFRDLLTSPIAFVNASTAPLYGLSAASYGADLQQVSLDPATRAGAFTRAGFLASYSLYDRPSPILRGAFLQKEVLCTVIPPPPPGVEGTPLPTTGATNRERVDAQTAGSECANCHHNVINPTGFALEAFDAVGSLQTTEKGTGAAVNTAADVLIGSKTVHVTGPVDLMTKIADSAEAQRCYAQKWVAYAYERLPTSQDACTVQNIATRMAQAGAGYKVVDLIADLTQSQSFRYRAKELP